MKRSTVYVVNVAEEAPLVAPKLSFEESGGPQRGLREMPEPGTDGVPEGDEEEAVGNQAEVLPLPRMTFEEQSR